MPKVGAHVSAAISLETSFKKALEIGAEATQIFISPPQQWTQTEHDLEEIEKYKKATEESGIGPNYIHGTYLVNLGTGSTEHLEKSINWLIYALTMGSKLGCNGIIFHLGSHKGVGFDKVLDQIINSLKKVLENSPKDINLLLETSAGAGGNIGSNFNELGKILKGVNHPKLKICLDTQHVFAAGYDIKNDLDGVLEEFDKEIGLENLLVIHANDSITEFKSNKDRHANIGEGFIGIDGFTNIINHPKLKDVTFILEVPGFTKTGPDAENVAKLKSLIK